MVIFIILLGILSACRKYICIIGALIHIILLVYSCLQSYVSFYCEKWLALGVQETYMRRIGSRLTFNTVKHLFGMMREKGRKGKKNESKEKNAKKEETVYYFLMISSSPFWIQKRIWNKSWSSIFFYIIDIYVLSFGINFGERMQMGWWLTWWLMVKL